MKAYSLDPRQKIVDAYDRKQGSQRQLAKTFGVSRSFVEKLFGNDAKLAAWRPNPKAVGINPCGPGGFTASGPTGAATA